MKYHIEFDIDFKKNPYKGLYIVFEGINACGKNTQIDRVKKYFIKQGKEVITTDEPSYTLVVGKFVRRIITKGEKISSLALQYLYTADRIVNHETIIVPALKKGQIVLVSRSFWSAIVYGVMDQGGFRYTRTDAERILVAQGVLSMYQRTLLPDATLYLDIPVEVALARMQKLQGKDIYETKEKLMQLREGYRWLLTQFPKEFTGINADRSIDEVTQEIIKRIKNKKI